MPSGAWADAVSRRSALVLAGVFQAAGHLLWITVPQFTGFAAGFVLWGIGGALASGAFQALVHDGLTVAGEADRYPDVIGRSAAAGLLVQLPVAVGASVLFAAGGYVLAGLVSVAVCLVAAAVASTLPDVRPADPADPPDDGEGGILASVRAGLREAARSSAVRGAALAVALLTSFDGLEEYFPLLAGGWGVPAAWVPLALVPVTLLAALAAASAGRVAGRAAPAAGRALLGGAALAFGAAVVLAEPAGLVGVALFYAAFRLAAVIADVRLQAAIDGPARATVTSAAGVGTDVAGIALYGAWALGGPLLAAAIALAVALALPHPNPLPRPLRRGAP